MENEGNGRLSPPPCLPRDVHIAIMGMEKVEWPAWKLVGRRFGPACFDALGHRHGLHHLLKQHLISGPRRICSSAASARVRLGAVALNPRPAAIRHYSKPMAGSNCAPHACPNASAAGACAEPLPGVHACGGGACLRHHLPRPDRQDHLAALLEARRHRRPSPPPPGLCGACGEVCPVRIPSRNYWSACAPKPTAIRTNR
ncbi:hypothetical protein ACU4GD_24830 [Cupriavidus basilensis]